MQILGYDIETQQWVYLEITPNKELKFYIVEAGQQESWKEVPFPQAPLLLGDVDDKPTPSYYYQQESNLYRYSQSPLPITRFPSNPISETERNKKLQEDKLTEEQLKEYEETKKQRIEKYIKSQNGFIAVDGNGKECAWRQYIEICNIKTNEWEVVSSFEKAPKGGVVLEKALPTNYPSPKSQRPNLSKIDENNWLIQRNTQPVLQDTKPAALKAVIWKLDEIVRQWLMNIKKATDSKQTYLQLVEVLLGNNEATKALKHNPLLRYTLQTRSDIKNIQLRDADTVSKDVIVSYVLECFQKEYESVSKQQLQFTPNAKIFTADNSEDDRQLNAALVIYEKFINQSSGLSVSEILNVFNRLSVNELPVNELNLVAHWLVASDTEISAQKFCKTLLAKKLYPKLNENEEALNALTETNASTVTEEALLATPYPAFFALLNLETALKLLHHPKLLEKLKGNQLSYLVEAHLLKLLESPELLKKLSSYQIELIANDHKGFALKLLESTELLEKLNGYQINSIANNHKDFALKLLESTELLEKLNNNQLEWIMKEHKAHKDFALKVLEKYPKLLEKLSGIQIGSIACFHEGFALKLLESTELLKKLSSYQIHSIANNHKDFALKLLESPQLLEKLNGYQINSIAQKYEDFALKLLESPKLLEKLDGNQIESIANNHEYFALELLESSKLLEKLDGNQIESIANKYKDSKLNLLKKDLEFLKNFDDKQLALLAKKHPHFKNYILNDFTRLNQLTSQQLYSMAHEHDDFALKLLEKPAILEKLDTAQLCNIVLDHSNVEKGVLNDLKLLNNLTSSQLFMLMRLEDKFLTNILQIPALLEKLDNTQLHMIAVESNIFSSYLLDHNPKILQKFSGDQLYDICKRKSSFKLALLDQYPELFSNFDETQILFLSDESKVFDSNYKNIKKIEKDLDKNKQLSRSALTFSGTVIENNKRLIISNTLKNSYFSKETAGFLINHYTNAHSVKSQFFYKEPRVMRCHLLLVWATLNYVQLYNAGLPTKGCDAIFTCFIETNDNSNSLGLNNKHQLSQLKELATIYKLIAKTATKKEETENHLSERADLSQAEQAVLTIVNKAFKEQAGKTSYNRKVPEALSKVLNTLTYEQLSLLGKGFEKDLLPAVNEQPGQALSQKVEL